MENILVTIVIPVYGVEKYLDRCVNSVVEQTYSNIEIILVDDESPDNCPSMCDAWAEKDHRIRVIHKKNAGLGMARNTGIENARGEYICFFDSDDYVEKNTIEKTIKLAMKQSAEIVIFGFYDVDIEGEVINSSVPAQDITCFRGKSIQEEFLPDLIDPRHKDAKYSSLILSACCCLYDMKLLRRTCFQFVSERQNISEDSYSLIWLYRYVQTVTLLPEAKYYYCKNSSSLTQTYQQNRFERIRLFYQDTLSMSKTQGYGETVITRIGGLFLSFSIAAMKQIVEADMNLQVKRKSLKSILENEELQLFLHSSGCCYRNITRKILIRFMKKQNVDMIILLMKLQNIYSR